MAAAATTCLLDQAAGQCGSLSYQIQPFAVGDPFGSFQSNPGTGESSAITITFSGSLDSFTATIQDPTYAGNTMSAFDDNGALVGTVSFAYSGGPGINVPDTRTISGPGITRVILQPAAADYVAYDASATPGVRTIKVVCTTNIARGSLVKCTSTLSSPAPFTVALRQTTGKDYRVTDTTPIVHNAGEADIWQGEAVASGDVHVEVDVNTNGRVERLQNTSTHFDIKARSWPVWKITKTIEHDNEVLLEKRMVEGVTGGVFGAGNAPQRVDPVISRPTQGPNSGLAYIKQPLNVDTWEYWIHPGLFPPTSPPGTPGRPLWNEWYDDQNGDPPKTCNATNISTLLKNVRKHEGLGINASSHPGIANQQWGQSHPERTFESMYTQSPDGVLRDMVVKAYDAAKTINGNSPYAVAQREFDANDPWQTNGMNGCKLDFNIFDK
jgi:hypothetical protein